MSNTLGKIEPHIYICQMFCLLFRKQISPNSFLILYFLNTQVTHPVVTSFLWLKWQRIRRFFNLNLRFYTLFVACLTWYIFARFAGHNWNGRVIFLEVKKEGDNSTSSVDFCSDILAEERGQRYGFWYGAFVFHCVS